MGRSGGQAGSVRCVCVCGAIMPTTAAWQPRRRSINQKLYKKPANFATRLAPLSRRRFPAFPAFSAFPELAEFPIPSSLYPAFAPGAGFASSSCVFFLLFAI